MRLPFNLKLHEELQWIYGRNYVTPDELDAYEDAVMTYSRMHDPSDWGVEMTGYWAERSVPFKFYERQKLLVINYSFLKQVWGLGTNEPLDGKNLERAAKFVGRMRFPSLKRVRISFSEDWGDAPR